MKVMFEYGDGRLARFPKDTPLSPAFLDAVEAAFHSGPEGPARAEEMVTGAGGTMVPSGGPGVRVRPGDEYRGFDSADPPPRRDPPPDFKQAAPAPNPVFVQALTVLRDLLKGGDHDGPCADVDKTRCASHLEALARRERAARDFLDAHPV